MSRGTYGRTSHKDIAQDARRLRPFLAANGVDTYRAKVSTDDTTPNFLEQKLVSADASVVFSVTNDGADEDLDLSVAVYVAAEIATHAADPDAHHNQAHVLADTSGLGPDHTTSGLTAGQVLRATGATTAAFANLQATDLPAHVLATTSGLGSQHTVSGLTAGQVLQATGATTAVFGALAHSNLASVSANQHHNQVHTITGSDHTVTGSPFAIVGLSATDTLGLLTPTSNASGATEAILKTDSAGALRVQSFTTDGGAVFNEDGGNSNTRIESQNNQNMVFIDADQDLVLFGSNTLDSSISDANLQSIDGDLAVSRSDSSNALISLYCYGTAFRPSVRARSARGSRSSPTASQADDVLSRWGGGGYTGSAFTAENTAYIQAEAVDNFSGTANGSRLDFYVTPVSTTSAAHAMRIAHDSSVYHYFPTATTQLIDSGTAAATEAGWIEIKIGGSTMYLRAYSSK